MTTYTAYFHTDAEWASHEFEADTPEQALALARQFYREDSSRLYFESYDGGMPVNEITISDADGEECMAWLDDDLRLSLAARDLLEALELALAALNTARRFRVPSLQPDSYQIAATCCKAIAKAKGGAL
jgi:hypothetical protein